MIPITKPRDEDEYYDRREKDESEIFCFSCGRIVKKTTSVCPSCGSLVNYTAFRMERYDKVADWDIVFSVLFGLLVVAISIMFIFVAVSTNQILYILSGPVTLGLGFITYYVVKKIKQSKTKKQL